MIYIGALELHAQTDSMSSFAWKSFIKIKRKTRWLFFTIEWFNEAKCENIHAKLSIQPVSKFFFGFFPLLNFHSVLFLQWKHTKLYDIDHYMILYMPSDLIWILNIFSIKKENRIAQQPTMVAFVLIVIRFLYCLSLVKICHRLEMQRTVILVFLLQNRIEKESITKLFAFAFAFDMNLNQRLRCL